MTKPKLLAISGSLRSGSYNRKLLAEAVRVFGDADVMQADLNLPLYDGDLEDRVGIPSAVQTLADQMSEADAIIIASPEYNKGIPGVLKNALDWVSRVEGNVMADKPTVVISAAAGRSGGETAQYMVMHCLVPHRARIVPGPAVLVAAASKEFDEDGRLLNEINMKALKERMANLRDAVA